MTTITIKSVSDLKQLIQKMKSLQRLMPSIQKTALERAADETILTEIHREMESKGISKKIIERTYVGKTEIINGVVVRVHIISDYISDSGFDVGEAREEGTRDHMIKPKSSNKTGKIWWISPNTGKLLSSKGHMVNGLPRLLIVEQTIQKNQSKFADSYFNSISSAYTQALGV